VFKLSLLLGGYRQLDNFNKNDLSRDADAYEVSMVFLIADY